MRKTPAEYQRAYRERQKAKEAERKRAQGFTASVDDISGCDPYAIAARTADHSFEFEENLDTLGYRIVDGLSTSQEVIRYRSHVAEEEMSMPVLDYLTSLAGTFLEAARELHEFINSYKVDDLNARIAALEADANLAPEIKALAVGRLTDIRARLQKEFRRNFPEITVKGD